MTAERSRYRFVRVAAPFAEFPWAGPVIEVRLREGDVVLGYVRRIEPGEPDGGCWAVFDVNGNERSVADQRNTAANLLRGDHERATAGQAR